MKTSANIARALFVSIAVTALFGGCGRRAEKIAAPNAAEPPRGEVVTTDQMPLPTPFPSASPTKTKARTMYASWYDVPADSLAARRAPPGELTAAHDHYRLGTKLRVTHAGNGRSVVVRVTDRGVPPGKAPLDLCKQAAAELDMVREGTAKVRVEVLPEEAVAGAPPVDAPTAAEP